MADINDTNVTLGEHDELVWRRNLRELGRRAGSQERLAQKAGVDQRSLARWINGQATPSIEKAASIATAMGVSLDWLVYGVDNAPGALIDEELLADAIEVLEVWLEEEGVDLPPDKKAICVCELYVRATDSVCEHKVDRGKAGRLLRLVK